VVGIIQKYATNVGDLPDESAVRSILARADCIVAHNASADRPLIAKIVPESEEMNWLCSFRGIQWKQLLGTQSESLQTLMGKVGLRCEQDHTALADARDLTALLASKHRGRTFLGRLLDGA
jgi:DNA polymerase-3 subunit epsilon